MKSLREITEYEDCDIIGWEIAVMLGIIDPEQYKFATDCKHVFWSNHPLGDAIYRFVQRLAKNGILEENPDDCTQYRWDPDYRGSWEKKLDDDKGVDSESRTD